MVTDDSVKQDDEVIVVVSTTHNCHDGNNNINNNNNSSSSSNNNQLRYEIRTTTTTTTTLAHNKNHHLPNDDDFIANNFGKKVVAATSGAATAVMAETSSSTSNSNNNNDNNLSSPSSLINKKQQQQVVVRPKIVISVKKRPRVLQTSTTTMKQQQQQQQQSSLPNKFNNLNKKRGLPSLSQCKHQRLIESAITEEGKRRQRKEEEENDNEFADKEFDTLLFEQTIVHNSTTNNTNVQLSDVYCVLQHLQSMNETCIEIPLVRDCGVGTDNQTNTISSSSTIRGVLECQIYERLLLQINNNNNHNNNNNDTSNIVSEELHSLFHNNVCRILSSLSSNSNNNNLQVIITTQDYIKGVQYAAGGLFLLDDHNSTSPGIADATAEKHQQQPEMILFHQYVLEWFTHHLLMDWTGRQISYAELQSSWLRHNRSRIPPLPPGLCNNYSFDNVIKLLQEEWQVLMIASSTHDIYQLWLPGFGKYVIKGWNQSVTKLMIELKRNYCSSRGEKSIKSLQKRFQYNNPIPLTVMISSLVANEKIMRIQRPFGLFVQLSKAVLEEWKEEKNKKTRR